MKSKEWLIVAGTVLILCFLFILLYFYAFPTESVRSSGTLVNSNTNNQNSFAQEWQKRYLSVRSPDCLKYLPTFHGEFWNNTPASKFNNCYAYVFRNMDLNRREKPQPGQMANLPEVPKQSYTCERLFQNVVSDHPGTIKWNSSIPCPCGSFKGHLVLSHNPPDYHFLREDSNGFWSQKLGAGAATQYDAAGNLITDPTQANLHYGDYNYSNPCFSFCIPYAKGESLW